MKIDPYRNIPNFDDSFFISNEFMHIFYDVMPLFENCLIHNVSKPAFALRLTDAFNIKINNINKSLKC